MLVTVGNRSAEHSLRSQVGMGSESDCLLGQLNRTLEISDSEAGLKVEKFVIGVEGGCEDADVELLATHIIDCLQYKGMMSTKPVFEKNRKVLRRSSVPLCGHVTFVLLTPASNIIIDKNHYILQ